MKKRITFGISFPDEKLLEVGKERAKALGIRSFSEYVNQLVRHDLGLPNYIEPFLKKPRSLDDDIAAADKLIADRDSARRKKKKHA
jgi:hypothetical protein